MIIELHGYSPLEVIRLLEELWEELKSNLFAGEIIFESISSVPRNIKGDSEKYLKLSYVPVPTELPEGADDGERVRLEQQSEALAEIIGVIARRSKIFALAKLDDWQFGERNGNG